jgi:tetratricopeptide (TPR) repeat protein
MPSRSLSASQPGGTFPDDVTREAAHDIVRLLGGFTLAVERAAICVGHLARDLDCAAFRDRLRSAGLSEFEQDDDESTIDGLCHSEACLSATLRPTLEQLGEPERIALIFAALLPADHIALPWVRELTAQAFPDLDEHGSDRLSDPWQDLSQRLFDLRLLQPGAQPQEARMHRLIQKIVRLHAGAETVALREQELLEHVKSRAEFLWEGWVRKENRWELVPLVALAWHWLHRGARLGVYLANQTFGSLRNLGRFAETEPLIRRALAVEEGSFGLNHPNVATCLNNLATLLHETSRLKEAEPIYRRALAIYERSFAPNDPRVATCLNNLAQLPPIWHQVRLRHFIRDCPAKSETPNGTVVIGSERVFQHVHISVQEDGCTPGPEKSSAIKSTRALQELVVRALEPLEGRCSQAPDGVVKDNLAGFGESA